MPTNDPQLGEIWFRRVNGVIEAHIVESVDSVVFDGTDNFVATAVDGELTPEEVKDLFEAGPPKSVWDRLLDED
jgi:hypothetical protein